MTVLYSIWDFFFTTSPTVGGPGEMTKTDVKKVLRLAAVMAFATFLTKAAEGLTPLDFGYYEPIVTLVLTGVSDLARRFATTSIQ